MNDKGVDQLRQRLIDRVTVATREENWAVAAAVLNCLEDLTQAERQWK